MARKKKKLRPKPRPSPSSKAVVAAVRKALERLRRKAVRVQKRRHTDIRHQLDRAQAALFPRGVPQERGVGALGLYARYGPGLAAAVRSVIDLDTRAHQVVEL